MECRKGNIELTKIMPKPTEVMFLEGTVVSVGMQFTYGQQTTVKLHDIEHNLVFPGIARIEVSSNLRAICAKDSVGNYFALDVILASNERPFTDVQRNEQARRVGIVPIYETPTNISVQPVLSQITEVEAELIRYLAKHPEMMREMHSDAFEKLVAEILASFGFYVEWTGRNAKTAGDVLAFSTGCESGLANNYIVECKRYSSNRPVGLEIARTLYGARCQERYSNALLVTTSRFQSGVEQFAQQEWSFHLRDFKGLVEWLNKYKPRADGRLYMSDQRLDLYKNQNG